jgi:hypothetical protein
MAQETFLTSLGPFHVIVPICVLIPVIVATLPSSSWWLSLLSLPLCPGPHCCCHHSGGGRGGAHWCSPGVISPPHCLSCHQFLLSTLQAAAHSGGVWLAHCHLPVHQHLPFVITIPPTNQSWGQVVCHAVLVVFKGLVGGPKK